MVADHHRSVPCCRCRLGETVYVRKRESSEAETLLLSSHDMEEADAIADQIVIMAAGVVVCTGSTTFLKKACGVGYKVTFTKVPQVFKLHDAMAVVQRTIPHAVVDDDKKEEVCIALGTMENENFPRMFRMLEGSMKRLGISSIGVSVASMKDVYLKINMDWAPGGKGREDPVDALATWLRPQQSLLKTLKNQEETLDVPIKLGTHFPDSTVVLGEAPATNLSKALRVLIESESCTVHATGNVTKELHEIIEDDFAAYILTYPMAVAFQSNTIRMMPNPTSAITSPIIINLVHTAWLRVLAAQPTLQNNITVTYLVAVPFEPLLALFIERVVGWLYWAEYSSASGSAVGSVFLWFYIGGIGPNCDEGLLQFSTDGVGFELAFLLAEGLLFLAYMIFKTSGYLSAGDPSPGDEAATDEDVAEEAKKVEAAVQKGDYVSNSILNAYEYLYLVGRLRGIADSDLKPMVDSVIAVVDLTEHASKQCGVYRFPFIFLDEPYAGVDVVSRNKIFRAIAEIKKRSKSTFVLTSHNMDECEFSCDRITIMVEGHMMCLGTLQHLREKFGKGFRLEFLLKHTAAADAPMLNAAVQQLFRGIELKQCHQLMQIPAVVAAGIDGARDSCFSLVTDIAAKATMPALRLHD
ncbi:hypothetical protein HPB51_026442 [Rhipicephalus microplus]|uniref:ABC transporter domain-containing protein n=1 Tax=Rhipicephalus microplus TaxID=6941 RepID=A0A9J6D336_RHIMP|nr:hypothetical protein HPB51_026442 [Rhipicephalus microplus]